MTSFFWSSPRPRWLNSKLRVGVAQHLVQRRPRQLLALRRVEELLDPRRVQVLGVAVPRVAQRPDAFRCCARRARRASLHGDVARDGRALRGVAVTRQLGLPLSDRRRCHLRDPEVRRAATPLTRCDRHLAIGRDQRKLALQRPLGGEDDAQGRALPRRHRRSQDAELGRFLAAGRRSIALCAGTRGYKCIRDQQQRCRGGGNLAFRKQWGPPGAPRRQCKHIGKALAEIMAKFIASGNFGNGNTCSAAPLPWNSEKPRLFRPVRLFRLAPGPPARPAAADVASTFPLPTREAGKR